MITVDVDAVGILLYVQLFLGVVLFFSLQVMLLLVMLLLAHGDRFEQVANWIVYRGTWYGIAFQYLCLFILALLVHRASTDHTRVTHSVILIVANVVWFAALRLVFLVAEYRHNRQMENE